MLNTLAGAAIPTEFPSVDSPPVDYVVVTSDALQEEFDRLADWKTEKGRARGGANGGVDR